MVLTMVEAGLRLPEEGKICRNERMAEMNMNTAMIKEIAMDKNGPLGGENKRAMFMGISGVTAAIAVMGLDENAHGRFLADYWSPDNGGEWQQAGSFVVNKAGLNMAEDKINYLIDQPKLQLVPETVMHAKREMWPGAIRLPYSASSDLILSFSGLDAFEDCVVIAAFALEAAKYSGLALDLSVFDSDAKYARAFERAERYLKIAIEMQLPLWKYVDEAGWQQWFADGMS